MSFTRSKLTRATAAAIGAVSTLVPAVGQAQPASINATQLSVTVAPISISGTAMGAELSAMGNGLDTVNIAGITANGALGVASATTILGSTFNFDVTGRAADTTPTSFVFANTDTLIPNTQFGSQSGSYSASTSDPNRLGTIALSNTNVATVSAGTNQGSSVTAIFSSTQSSDSAETSIRRIATSGNDQATFTTERQSARYQIGGAGLTAITANLGFAATAAVSTGAVPVFTTPDGGAVQGNVAFTRTEQRQNGQAANVATASSTSLTQPNYGTFTNTLGGTTAGAITPTSINGMTVLSGNAGTTSTLSLIQNLTAF